MVHKLILRARGRDSLADRWLFLTVAAASVLAARFQLPRLLDPYQVEEDFRSFYWMHRFQNRELFDGDPLIYDRVVEPEWGSLFLIFDNASPAYSLLFQIASNFVNPVLFSKLLAIPLLLFAVYYLFRIGEKLSGPGTALVLCLFFIFLNLAAPTSISTVGGLQRSFVFPLFLALIYYLMIGRDWAAAVTIFTSGLVYPPVFLIGVVTYALSLAPWPEAGHRLQLQWRRLWPLSAAVALTVVALLPILGLQLAAAQPGAGLAEETPHMLADPHYQQGGAFVLFDVFPLVGRAGLASWPMAAAYAVLFSAFALVVWWQRPATLSHFPSVLKHFFWASWICFALSWLAIWLTSSSLLYLPSRYTEASLFLFLFVYVVVNAEATVTTAVATLTRQKERLLWLLAPAILLVMPVLVGVNNPGEQGLLASKARLLLLGLTVLLVPLLFLVARRRHSYGPVRQAAVASHESRLAPGQWAILVVPVVVGLFYFTLVFQMPFYVATPEERALFAYLESLPEDIVVGGDLCTLDSVPLFAKRRVLFSCEEPELRPDIALDALFAYYAENGNEVYAFCQTYGVDYLLVNQRKFSQHYLETGYFYYEPFLSQLRAGIGNRTTFYLNDLPERYRLFQANHLFVIACDQDTLEEK
jgi:hypothetical protein